MLSYLKTKIKNQKVRLKEWSDRFYVWKNKDKVLFDFDKSWFDGKSIAIIGGADTALQEKNGDYIDTFDIVIRINRGIDNYLDKTEYLGSKTDVLFHGLNEDPINGCGPVKPIEWLKKGVKKVVFPLVGIGESGLINTYILRSQAKLPLLRITEGEYSEITKALKGYRTTTGFAAIYLMSKVNYKKLYITGFTFFRTKHQAGYNDKVSIDQVRENIKKFNLHNPDMEFEYFQDICLNMNNIEIDKGMKDIFQFKSVN